MSDITALAEKLGKAIADSPQATKLRDARKDMEAQSDLMQVMTDFREHSDKLAALEQQGGICQCQGRNPEVISFCTDWPI